MEQHSELAIIPAQERPILDTHHRSFIEANTSPMYLEDMQASHIIPVFVKDNEPLISHTDFVETTASIAADVFHGELVRPPIIRVSHPIKGRIPEARNKPVHLLQEWEKTIYYERMMFVVEIPSIQDNVGGNTLSLTLGGVKAYNQDNLYSRTQSDQHFKVFIGFQNRVCTNLCVWTEGYLGDIKVKTLGQLSGSIRALIESYQQDKHLEHLRAFCEHSLTEQQFAQLIGRCRMYHHLPADLKADIPPILFGDQQINSVVKDYYRDDSFCRDRQGNINLWKLYNLFTGANKSSYVDSFLDRSVNAYSLTKSIYEGLEGRRPYWYLH